MDFGAGLADIAAHALCLQAGAVAALAIALAAAVARARGQADACAARISAENEGLRDELWRLKETASARDRAEAASEAKSRFLTTMSHEIRTPISGILGMADLLREGSLGPENASYVEAIRSSGSALVSLIDQILDDLHLVDRVGVDRTLIDEIDAEFGGRFLTARLHRVEIRDADDLRHERDFLVGRERESGADRE